MIVPTETTPAPAPAAAVAVGGTPFEVRIDSRDRAHRRGTDAARSATDGDGGTQ